MKLAKISKVKNTLIQLSQMINPYVKNHIKKNLINEKKAYRNCMPNCLRC